MPDLRRYAPGTRTSESGRRRGTWGRGTGAHIRPRRPHPRVRVAVALAVLVAPAVYLAAGYGPGTPPIAAYLTGVILGVLLRPVVARKGRR